MLKATKLARNCPASPSQDASNIFLSDIYILISIFPYAFFSIFFQLCFSLKKPAVSPNQFLIQNLNIVIEVPYYHKIHTDFKLYQCPPPYEILTEYFFILYLIILFEKCCIISNNYVNDEIKALKRKLYFCISEYFSNSCKFSAV